MFFLEVPVKSSSISPYKDILTTAENITFSWQCTTSKCRPAPRFLWYKRYSTQPDGDETVIWNASVISSSILALESYSNNLSIRLDKAWNGWYLFCGAQNRNGDVVQTRHILINVTCKFLYFVNYVANKTAYNIQLTIWNIIGICYKMQYVYSALG